MTPQLSIITTSLDARGTIERSLASVEPQRDEVDLELILVDSSTDGTDEIVAQRFPWVKVLHFNERKFCGDGRNIGIAASSAPVIAFLDADCEAAPDWARQIVAAHGGSKAAVIGGAVANGNPKSWWGWSYYFTEFARWAPGMAAREVDEVPGCSLTMKRSAYDRYGPFIEGTYCSDSAFHWAMARDGQRPRFDPSIRVSHINPTALGAIVRHAFSHGRQFGRVRRTHTRPSPFRLLAWRVGGSILPLLLFSRTLGNVAWNGIELWRFLACAPAVFLVQLSWSLGEWLSYCQPDAAAAPRGNP